MGQSPLKHTKMSPFCFVFDKWLLDQGCLLLHLRVSICRHVCTVCALGVQSEAFGLVLGAFGFVHRTIYPQSPLREREKGEIY